MLAALAALAAPAAAQPAGGDAPAQPAEGDVPPPPEAAPSPPEAPVKDPKLARKWLLAGQQLVQKGDWLVRAKRPDEAKTHYENAVTAFEKSIEVGEDPGTHALLADALEKLGKPDLAVKHLRVLVKAEAGVRPDVLKKATARLDELSMQVGIVTLNVRPDGAVIALAGVELGKTPLAEPLILLPGTYTLAFEAEGFQPREVELNVEAGSESERAIELEAVKIVVEPPAPETVPVPPPRPAPSRLPLYAGGAAGATLLGVAAVTGLLALGRHGTYTGSDSTPAERADARSSGKALALVTDLAVVGGLAAGGFTAYWYFVKYRPALQKRTEQRPAAARTARGRPDAAQSTKVDLIPWVQSGASGLTLVGAF